MKVLAKVEMPPEATMHIKDYMGDTENLWICVDVYRLTWLDLAAAVRGRLLDDGYSFGRVQRSAISEYLPWTTERRRYE